MLDYNIDELKAESGAPAKLLFRLWELWGMGAETEPLLPEERVVNDAWIYDTANGNGLWDMLINERYDEIAAGLDALRQLGSPDLAAYIASITAVFARCGTNCFDPISIETSFCRGKLPRELVEAAEQPLLKCLWDGAIIDAALNYIDRHIDAFRNRRLVA